MNVENDLGSVVNCPHCGSPIRYEDNFCGSCGAANDAWTEPDPILCGNCGARVRSGDRYCRSCGARVNEAAEEPLDSGFGVLIDTPDPSDMYFLPIDDAIDEVEWEEDKDE